MRRLPAAFPGLPGDPGDPIHARHRTPVAALVELPGPYLSNGQVRVAGRVDHLQHRCPLRFGQGLRARCARRPRSLDRRAGVPVVTDPRPADELARRRHRQPSTGQRGERLVHDLLDPVGGSAFPMIDNAAWVCASFLSGADSRPGAGRSRPVPTGAAFAPTWCRRGRGPPSPRHRGRSPTHGRGSRTDPPAAGPRISHHAGPLRTRRRSAPCTPR